MTSPATHVVFGAGQIGTPLARVLRERGHTVRLVRRSGGGPDGVEVRHGDAGDAAFAAEAARGASVVYHCMNPAYDAALWKRELPRLMDSLVEAAGRARARLVVLDNLYMFGRTHGRPINEATPVNPCSPKGEIRARVAERLFAAHTRGDVLAVSGRAADFYGPGGASTYFGAAFWPRVLTGRTAQVLSDPELIHSYHYIEDVVHGLAALGGAPDDVTGRWWMLPVEPAVTTHEMIRRFGESLGRPIPIERVPAVILGAMALLVPMIREIREMRYEFSEPFIADDARFRARFSPSTAEGMTAARRTVDWALRQYGLR